MRLVRGSDPHERGVFEDEYYFRGLSAFRLHNCTGRVIERTQTATFLADPFYWNHLYALLNHRCPRNHAGWGVSCPSDGVFEVTADESRDG